VVLLTPEKSRSEKWLAKMLGVWICPDERNTWFELATVAKVEPNHAKQVAKRWGSVKGKIDFFLLSFSSITDHSTLLIIIHSIFNDIDAIGGSLEDVPDIAEVPKKMTAVRELLADFHTQV
jgi:hypothetical protein